MNIKQFSWNELVELKDIPLYYGDSENQQDGKIIIFNNMIFQNIHTIKCVKVNRSVFLRLHNYRNEVVVSCYVENDKSLKINIETGEYLVS